MVESKYLTPPPLFEQNLVPNYVKARVMETLMWIQEKIETEGADSKLLETQIKYLQFAKELADKAPSDPMEKYRNMRAMMQSETGVTKKLTMTVEETVSG